LNLNRFYPGNISGVALILEIEWSIPEPNIIVPKETEYQSERASEFIGELLRTFDTIDEGFQFRLVYIDARTIRTKVFLDRFAFVRAV
jgi:hypothetical protein